MIYTNNLFNEFKIKYFSIINLKLINSVKKLIFLNLIKFKNIYIMTTKTIEKLLYSNKINNICNKIIEAIPLKGSYSLSRRICNI